MALKFERKSGAFTAADFRARAASRALPLQNAADLAGSDAVSYGDHDLNPELADLPPPPGGLRLASVLVGIVDREPGATVILTLRSADMPTHAGQIAFPGGRMDARDATVIDAALREADEEIGLAPSHVTPIGLIDSYRTRTGFRIVPVLAIVAPPFTIQPQEREVADVFEVPLGFLMNASNHQRHSREWEGRLRHFYAMPYGERYIWGVTAGILRAIYERLYAE
jgi:8-oxo-dGTP pyrophosphatase MutT (NUDIX family)